jgi:hypothetical protein
MLLGIRFVMTWPLRITAKATYGMPSEHVKQSTDAVRPAEAMVQLLSAEYVEGRKFSLVSMEGDGPGQDTAAWQRLFTSAYS